MAIETSVALSAAELDACADNLERQTCLAKFFADRESLDLCEISEIANAEASGRFITNVTNQVSCGKVVAIKFLVVRTLLLPNIDRASNRRDAHHVFKGAGDGH